MERPGQWKELRKTGIGGSDIGAILGENPYKDAYQVWLEKIDPFAPDIIETPAMTRGKELETKILQVYTKQTARSAATHWETSARTVTKEPLMLRHKNIEWLIGSPDAIITNGMANGDPGILEIKAPGIHVFNKIKREGLPTMYALQGHHYMNVTGFGWASFAIFSAEKWELIWFDVQADPQLNEVLIKRCSEFWDLVKTRTPPPVEKETIDLPDTGQSQVIDISSPEWETAIMELQEAKILKAEAEELEESTKLRLQAMMGKNQIAQSPTARVYWTPQFRTTLDTKALKKDQPDLYEKYSKTTTSRPFRPFFLKPRAEEIL